MERPNTMIGLLMTPLKDLGRQVGVRKDSGSAALGLPVIGKSMPKELIEARVALGGLMLLRSRLSVLPAAIPLSAALGAVERYLSAISAAEGGPRPAGLAIPTKEIMELTSQGMTFLDDVTRKCLNTFASAGVREEASRRPASASPGVTVMGAGGAASPTGPSTFTGGRTRMRRENLYSASQQASQAVQVQELHTMPADMKAELGLTGMSQPVRVA